MAMTTATSISNPSIPSSKQAKTLRPTVFGSSLRMPITCSTKFPNKHLSTYSSLTLSAPPQPRHLLLFPQPSTTLHSLCYVLGDNLNTDQIIPAEYLTLVASKLDEYRKLGSFSLIGLPATYTPRFFEQGEENTKHSIIVGGENFRCGSSREHAPVALGAAGVKDVVVESYARIFFNNSLAIGEIYPIDFEGRLCDECTTRDVGLIELVENLLINDTTGKEYKLKNIGDAGRIFAFARKTGMIPSAAPSS